MLKLTLTQKQIGAFTSTEENRPAMQGVFVDNNNLIATDGHVLLVYPCETEYSGIVIPVSCFPKKKGNYTIVELEKQVADIVGLKLTVTEYDSKTQQEEETRIEKVIREPYPKYKNVMPQEGTELEVKMIGINPLFLAKFSALHEHKSDDAGLQLTFHGPTNAITIKHDEFTGLLMPTRL